jgi:transposase
METKPKKSTTENFVKDVRRKTRRLFTSEQKILIVMEAIRGEIPVTELCQKYGIHQAQFYLWNKEFLEAGKKRLTGDTTREATSSEVDDLRKENLKLKELLADMMLRHEIVKKGLDMFEKLNG